MHSSVISSGLGGVDDAKNLMFKVLGFELRCGVSGREGSHMVAVDPSEPQSRPAL